MSYYVYSLCDPWTRKPFYIGKGKGDRAYQHERDALRKSPRTKINKAKTERILEIVKAGKRPLVRIVDRFANEQDALDREAHLIATLPGLTNIAKRGTLTPARDPIEYLRRWYAAVSRWPYGATFPGLPDGDKLAAELVEFVRQVLVEQDLGAA